MTTQQEVAQLFLLVTVVGFDEGKLNSTYFKSYTNPIHSYSHGYTAYNIQTACNLLFLNLHVFKTFWVFPVLTVDDQRPTPIHFTVSH